MTYRGTALHIIITRNRRLLFKQVLKRRLVTQLQSHAELKHRILYR